MSAQDTAEAILMVIKRIAKWILYLILALSMFAVFIWLIYELKNAYDKRPKIVSSFKNISLGDKYSDFMFKHPGFVLDKKAERGLPGDVIYENKEASLSVAISDNRVVEITYICKSQYEYTEINGIECKWSGERIIEKYDRDLKVQCLKDDADVLAGTYRVYDAIKFGVRHHVFSNELQAIGVMDPKRLELLTGVNWGKCK